MRLLDGFQDNLGLYITQCDDFNIFLFVILLYKSHRINTTVMLFLFGIQTFLLDICDGRSTIIYIDTVYFKAYLRTYKSISVT